MPETIEIKNFPAHRLERARDLVAQAHTRVARAAKRAGQDAPAAPVVAVAASRFESGPCGHCGRVQVGPSPVAECPASGCAYSRSALRSREVLDLEVTCERPRLAGWDFLAVVEPLVGGNLIRRVPGAEVADGELERWRSSDLACDHCRTARRRAETFILRADGSDPAVPAGEYKQVGRSCLEAFLGGRSPAEIVSRLTWESIILGCAGDGEGGLGGGPEHHEPAAFLAWTASSIRIAGWTSRAKARERGDGSPSTADQVLYLMTPPFGVAGRDKWLAAREQFRPTAEDEARGRAALEWAAGLEPKSDYERNLSLVARQPSVGSEHAGILASAVSAHARVLGEQLARAKRGESRHLGAVGDKKRDFGVVTVERVSSVDTQYGTLFIHSFRDAEGNALLWKTGESRGAAGDKLRLVGTVKAHGEFRGEKQTELTRCKLEKRSGR